MANPFGLNFEEASIATTFATCVACFDYALSGGSNGRAALRLNILRLRLGRWGEAVNIYHDSKLGQADPDPEDVEKVKGALVKLIARFESFNEETKGLTLNKSDGQQQPPLTIFTVLDEMASKRPQHPGLLNPRVLVLGGQPELLVREASACVDELEEYFPAVQRQQELCYKEKAEIADASVLMTLQEEARGIDPWISPPIKIGFNHGGTVDVKKYNNNSGSGSQFNGVGGGNIAGSSRLFER
jgi:hypothetical protein